MLAKLNSIRKAIVSALGTTLTVLALVDKIPFLPPTVAAPIGVAIAVLTPLLTYLVPNKSGGAA